MARLPSTQSLRAIEAFARHGTVWQAADELNLTRSAVSHQLRLLERELDFTLLNRVGTRVELTVRGRAYAEDVRRALGMISDSAVRNTTSETGGTITVSSPPGFASGWLCARIGEFLATHPDIVVNIITPRRLDSTANPDVDVFITFGTEVQSDLVTDILQTVEFTPMCSPAYLNRFNGFSSARHLREATLLHIFDFSDWENWMRARGLPPREAQRGVVCRDMNLVYAAALASQGIAMGDQFVCRSILASGQIVRAFEESIPADSAYFLVTPPAKLDLPNVQAFQAWLKGALRKQEAV